MIAMAYRRTNMTSAQPQAANSESSQSVLSIHELAKKSITSLPQFSYMVNAGSHEREAINETFCSTIPMIDLEKLIHGEATELEQEKLHLACRDWGFFQLVNHGVSPLILKKLKDEIEEFYKLPSEELMKYKPIPGDVEGYGAVIRADKKLDWGDKVYMITNPVHRRKPHLFPQFPSGFRAILEVYMVELENLAITLLGFLGKALIIEKGEMEEMYRDGMQSMRMTYYPPCPQPELVMGLTAHPDACGITILNQVNGVDALQMKKDGVWIPFKIMSNGLYKSVDHRATVNSGKERFSLAMFFNPKNEKNIYKRVGMEKNMRDFFARNKVDGKSYLEQMKLTNENATN